LIIGESHAPTADLLPQNTIFLNQIFDELLLPLIDLPSNRNDKK